MMKSSIFFCIMVVTLIGASFSAHADPKTDFENAPTLASGTQAEAFQQVMNVWRKGSESVSIGLDTVYDCHDDLASRKLHITPSLPQILGTDGVYTINDPKNKAVYKVKGEVVNHIEPFASSNFSPNCPGYPVFKLYYEFQQMGKTVYGSCDQMTPDDSEIILALAKEGSTETQIARAIRQATEQRAQGFQKGELVRLQNQVAAQQAELKRQADAQAAAESIRLQQRLNRRVKLNPHSGNGQM